MCWKAHDSHFRLAVTDLATVSGHPALAHFYGVQGDSGTSIAYAGAVFGSTPHATRWQMAHGAGGGIEDVTRWIDDAERVWARAKAAVVPLSGTCSAAL